jgi:hypothetical protein
MIHSSKLPVADFQRYDFTLIGGKHFYHGLPLGQNCYFFSHHPSFHKTVVPCGKTVTVHAVPSLKLDKNTPPLFINYTFDHNTSLV